jgi:hypothetical protein
MPPPQHPDARAPDYRAYVLGIDGHRFLKAARFLSDHPDDVAAIAAAKTLVEGHDVELWDHNRFVARLSPGGGTQLAPMSMPTDAQKAGAK